MPFYFILWTSDREAKLAENGIDPADFDAIVQEPEFIEQSRSSNRTVAFGEDSEGRFIACVYELSADGMTVLPITAYPTED